MRKFFLACLLTMTSAMVLAQSNALSGANIQGWTSVIGDGVYVAPQEAPLTISDIKNDHYSDATVMKANVLRKDAMVHHISFIRETDGALFTATHRASYEFRLLSLPDVNDVEMAGQTVEGGLFVWDGVQTKLDYGAAFQWIVNPRSPDYGRIFAWFANAEGDRYWRVVGVLPPDTAWHRLEVVVNPAARTATLAIDGGKIFVPDALALERKPDFGNDRAARLQFEIISADPRIVSDKVRRYHAAAVRNWSWIREGGN